MTTNSKTAKNAKTLPSHPESPLAVTKSDLIESIAEKNKDFSQRDIELAVKTILEQMSQSLASGERIEIRGFGSFSLHQRGARTGRNPKTGEAVQLESKNVPHFKPGKELRERVNSAWISQEPPPPPATGKASNGTKAKATEEKATAKPAATTSKKSEAVVEASKGSRGRRKSPSQTTSS
jgi:integration host factor subunit beta